MGRIIFLGLALTFCLGTWSSQGFGASSGTKSGWFFDAFTSAGYASPTPVGSAAGAANPTLGIYTVGASAGYFLTSMFFLGLTTDYRFINQYTDPSKTGGNYRGTRFDYVALLLGMDLGSFLIKLDLEFLGNYNLTNTDPYNGTASYTKPAGGRLMGLLPVFGDKFHVGAFVEVVSFTGITSSATGDAALSPAFSIVSFGPVLEKEF